MNTKIKSIIVCSVMALFIFGFSALCIFMPKPEFLDSERREPEKLPALTIENIMKDGKDYATSFMKLFDDKYTPDNFPFRETFRKIKAFVGTYLFGQRDKDGVFIADGYATEMQEQINMDSIAHASSKLQFIYDKYLKDKGVTPYISIIPDKAFFLADPNGYLTMDYELFITEMLSAVNFATYIDIKDSLTIENYYYSDTHWRQETLTEIAGLLVNGMGGNYDSKYTVNTLDNPFYGVYAGRAPKPLKPETIYYLTNDNMQNIVVTDYQNGGKKTTIYDMDKAYGKDPYDMFLGGELSKITIENPNAKTDKELVVFRDSFGRSILPLMADDYAKITVIDIRYQVPQFLLNGVNFENADVLFLYSTLVLNNSFELK